MPDKSTLNNIKNNIQLFAIKIGAITQVLLSKGYALQNVNIRRALEAKRGCTYSNEM